MLRLYDFECNYCGRQKEFMVYPDEEPECPLCCCDMKRLPPVFRINMGPVPLVGYWDDNLNTYIRTNTHRKQIMADQGVTEKGATPRVVE